MKHLLKLTVLLIPLLTGCLATTPKQTLVDFDKTFTVGSVYTDSILIGEKRIPLRPGEWVLVGKSSKLHETQYIGGAMAAMIHDSISSSGRLFLAKIEDKAVTEFTTIHARLSHIKPRNWMIYSCEKPNALFLKKISVNDRQFDCWWIYSVSLATHKNLKSPHTLEGIAYLNNTLKVDVPRRMIGVAHYVSKADDYLFVNYILPYEFDEDISWDKNFLTEEQEQYIRGRIEWGEEWHPRVQAAIEREPKSK